jgi:hypothetical protein
MHNDFDSEMMAGACMAGSTNWKALMVVLSASC